MNYAEIYPGDYLRDTAGLSLAEHGAYLKLMLAYYSSETPLPADISKLNRICGAQTASERQAVANVADQYFPIDQDGTRHNGRCDREIGKARVRIEIAKANGAKGGRPSKPKPNPAGIPAAYPAGIPSETRSGEALHTPHANLKAKAKDCAPAGALPSDIDPQVAADFTAHRKALRAPITPTAVKGIQREADKAGLSLEAALAMCCARGWRGFKAEWVGQDAAIGSGRHGANGNSKHLAGVAGFLGVKPHELIPATDASVVSDADRRGLGGPIPAEPRRLPGG